MEDNSSEGIHVQTVGSDIIQDRGLELPITPINELLELRRELTELNIIFENSIRELKRKYTSELNKRDEVID